MGNTFLIDLCKKNDIKNIQENRAKCTNKMFRELDENGESALIIACKNKNTDLALLLLDILVEINTRERINDQLHKYGSMDDGNVPLEKIIRRDKIKDIINCPFYSSNKALSCAIINNMLSVAQKLVEFGAVEIDNYTPTNYVPILLATALNNRNNLEIVKLYTAIMYLCNRISTNDEQKIILQLINLIIEKLKKHVVIEYVNKKSHPDRQTALIIACTKGNNLLAQKLIECGADVNCRDRYR